MTYSWGQLRLLLQQFADPGVSLDVIDEKLNGRYSLLLSLMNWQGLEVAGMLRTLAAYTTGTVAVTQGSSSVVGTGTTWLTGMSGQQFFTCFGLPYTVTITSPTALTLDRPFEGDSNAAFGYWLGQALYQLPDNCRNLKTITSPDLLRAIPPMDETEFAQLEGSPIIGGPAVRYVPQPDGINASSGATVKQIMLWPLPSIAKGYPILYEENAEGFDGVSTTDGPLAFVSSFALLAGCKADLELEKKTPNMVKAEGFEAAFMSHRTGMIHTETSNKPYPRVRMADQYTRHRLARVLRGLGGYFRDC